MPEKGIKIKGYKLPFHILTEDDVNYLLKQGIEKYTIPVWDKALEIIIASKVTTLTALWNEWRIYIGNTISPDGTKKNFITPFTVVAAKHGVRIVEVTEHWILVKEKEKKK